MFTCVSAAQDRPQGGLGTVVQVSSGFLKIAALVTLLPLFSSLHWYSLAALSIAGVWAMVLTLRRSFKTITDVLPSYPSSGWGCRVFYPNPKSRLTSPGFCSGHEVVAFVRAVVPYTLALSSKHFRPVTSPALRRPVASQASYRRVALRPLKALLSSFQIIPKTQNTTISIRCPIKLQKPSINHPLVYDGRSLSGMGLTRERWSCARGWLSRLDMNTFQTSRKIGFLM